MTISVFCRDGVERCEGCRLAFGLDEAEDFRDNDDDGLGIEGVSKRWNERLEARCGRRGGKDSEC
jgi:hypothetical protein